jgi:hypothetical protein
MTESTLARQPAPSLSKVAGALLTFGIGLDKTTLCLLENISGHYRLAAWDSIAREAGIPPSHQCAALCRRLGEQLGRTLWDEQANRPFLSSEDPITQPPLDHVTIGLSPRPRMRVWLVGLTEGESIAAARRALVSTPLHLLGVTTLTPHLASTQLTLQLTEAHPEALVLVGGYDLPTTAAQQWVLELSRIVGQALERLSPGQRPAVFYAGNRWCAEGIEQGLRRMNGPLQFTALPNVLPAPGITQPAALGVALSSYYWRLCQQMPGINQLNQWVTAPGRIVNLEAAFAQMVQVWMEYHRLPRLHGLYCPTRLGAPERAPNASLRSSTHVDELFEGLPTDLSASLRAEAQANLSASARKEAQADWWLHVWADQAEQGVQLRFVKPGVRPPELAQWPPLQVVSGEWPLDLWSPPDICWWDRSGLAPMVATSGQVAPAAMVQVLKYDLLEPRRRRS